MKNGGGGGGEGGGLDGTKKLTTHAHARKLFNFSLRWLKGDSFSFCLIDSFFLIDLGLCWGRTRLNQETRMFHSMRLTVLRTSPLGGLREIVSAFVL